MSLAKNMHIFKQTKRLEQNLGREDKIKNRNNNSNKNLVKKKDELIILQSVTKQFGSKIYNKI